MSSDNASPGAQTKTAGKTMFDEIPFQNVSAFDPPGPVASLPNVLGLDPVSAAVNGAYDLLYSSGKVAAEAAGNSMRSIWSVLTGSASAANAKAGSNQMDPLAAPAGPTSMVRAGAGGGDIIDKWTSIAWDDVKTAGQKIKSDISTVGAEVKTGTVSALSTVGSGIQGIIKFTGNTLGQGVGSIFKGLGLGSSAIIILILLAVVLFFVAPFAGPLLASRTSR